MKFTNWLNTPPKKPLIGAFSITSTICSTEKWGEALDNAHASHKNDKEYKLLKSFIPTGHVEFPHPHTQFWFSEEFIHNIRFDSQFFIAWKKMNDL